MVLRFGDMVGPEMTSVFLSISRNENSPTLLVAATYRECVSINKLKSRSERQLHWLISTVTRVSTLRKAFG
ncbi:hypothetical protein Cantr_01458 [Candida viswanathii]|uniref:Uncharacterized protein n=1 Tax=Candida viswanathii TaxID=5486 RepID=A0A367YJ01_9ASCO|nr:hypothetical protein Cantr_01458 [Candida viswanathii]